MPFRPLLPTVAGGLAALASAVAVAVVGAAGCQPSTALDPALSGGGGRGGSAPPTGGAGGASVACTPDPGPAEMHRLTGAAYDNSLRTLLPQTTLTQPPSASLPWEGTWRSQRFFEESVSPVAVQAYLQVAVELAIAQKGTPAAALLETGCQAAGAAASNSDEDCARGLATWFGKRAYRRPLFDEETAILLEAYHAGRAIAGTETGVMALMAAVLQAPQFLYRAEFGEPVPGDPQHFRPTAHETASRLSYLLWGDLPDDELVRAADQGRLSSREQIAAQVTRMMTDARARSLTRRFYGGWFDLDGLLADVRRDPAQFPEFTDVIRRDMRRETERFLEHHYWETDSDLTSLLTAPMTFVTPALAAYYGLPPLPDGADLTMVALDPARRAGLLTQGSLMTLLSHEQSTSPVWRGEFVLNNLLCAELPPPPASVPNIGYQPLPPDATTRERLTIHSRDAICATCHHLIDPPGFAFEHLDPVGRWRDTENGKPIDSSGTLGPPFFDRPTDFANAPQMLASMATSDRVRGCMVRQWFRFAFGRIADETIDACTLKAADQGFADTGYRINQLIAVLARTDAFLYRRPQGGQP